jgi:hypothetical protein
MATKTFASAMLQPQDGMHSDMQSQRNLAATTATPVTALLVEECPRTVLSPRYRLPQHAGAAAQCCSDARTQTQRLTRRVHFCTLQIVSHQC